MRCVGLRRAQRGIAHRRSVGLRKGRSAGPRHAAAQGAQHAGALRRSVGLRRCAVWGCARAQHAAAQGAQRAAEQGAQRAAAQGRNVGLRRGTVRGWVGAQHATVHPPSNPGRQAVLATPRAALVPLDFPTLTSHPFESLVWGGAMEGLQGMTRSTTATCLPRTSLQGGNSSVPLEGEWLVRFLDPGPEMVLVKDSPKPPPPHA